MRTTLIASSVAALALAGLAGGAVYAAESGASPGAAPETTVGPGMDIFADMGLTPEQGECLVANVGSVDTSDVTALMELMTQCGVSTDQLLEIGQTASATTEAGAPATATVESMPAELDPAVVAAVFALMGLDPTAVDCLVTESADVIDEATAEQAFFNCGVGPAQILAGIVALASQSGVVATDDTATATVAPPTQASIEPSGNAMVDLLLEQLAAQGINLDAEQGQCLLDNISGLDPNDMSAIFAVFETCGIEITDLLPEG